VDNRSEGRSNVFLVGTLDAGDASAPVRIRNLSEHGALVEGSALPAVGAKVRLLRGRLSAAGQIAWLGHRHGGVNFDAQIDVDSWVQRVGHVGQQRIDGLVAAIRGSKSIPSGLQHAPKIQSLAAINLELERICERLAAMPDMSVALSEELLKLDVLCQSLRQIAAHRKT
jgi:hypothetical protein